MLQLKITILPPAPHAQTETHIEFSSAESYPLVHSQGWSTTVIENSVTCTAGDPLHSSVYNALTRSAKLIFAVSGVKTTL